MTSYRYKFHSRKEACPSCLHKQKFSRYVDTATDELLPPQYGKCERVHSCGYELNPYEDGYHKAVKEAERNNVLTDWKPQRNIQPRRPQNSTLSTHPVVFIPNELKNASLTNYDQNNFVKYLNRSFNPQKVAEAIALYQVGTSKHWQGATVFWYVDIEGHVRAGQVKDFDNDGHTIEDMLADGKTKSRTTWMHSILKYRQPQPLWLADYCKQEQKVSCLFAEHLLRLFPDKIVRLVESPKTAIIGSLLFPQHLWLAVGALDYLTAERCKAIQNRKVILFPDLSAPKEGKLTAFELWSSKAKELGGSRWTVNPYLEKEVDTITEQDRIDGLDLADYWPRDCKEFALQKPAIVEPTKDGVAFHDPTPKPAVVEPPQSNFAKNDGVEAGHKDFVTLTKNLVNGVPCGKDIEALENYFAALPLPKVIQLDSFVTITNVQVFLKEHFRILRGKDSSKNARPHFERLQTLKQLSEQSSFDWSNPQPLDFCSDAPKQSVIQQSEYIEHTFDWNDLQSLDFRNDAPFCPVRWASREGIGIDSIVPSKNSNTII